MPCRYRRVAPYLFTPGQVDALIQAAAALPHPLRALNYTTLIALLTVTGMFSRGAKRTSDSFSCFGCSGSG